MYDLIFADVNEAEANNLWKKELTKPKKDAEREKDDHEMEKDEHGTESLN